jgi:hypothetical protein
LDSIPSGRLSFPTAPYITKSLTQQRLSPSERKKLTTTIGKNAEKTSTTLYKILHQTHLLTVLACSPVTGHFHQIRIHCAGNEGFQAPILGDDKYSSGQVYGFEGVLPTSLLTKIQSNLQPIVGKSQPELTSVKFAKTLGTSHTLNSYYTTVGQLLNDHYGSNIGELHLIAHSISFPHPSTLSTFFHQLNSAPDSPHHPRYDFMPFDQFEANFASQYLQAAEHLFPTSSYQAVDQSTTISRDPQSLPMLTITCNLPKFFTQTLSTAGVKMM